MHACMQPRCPGETDSCYHSAAHVLLRRWPSPVLHTAARAATRTPGLLATEPTDYYSWPPSATPLLEHPPCAAAAAAKECQGER